MTRLGFGSTSRAAMVGAAIALHLSGCAIDGRSVTTLTYLRDVFSLAWQVSILCAILVLLAAIFRRSCQRPAGMVILPFEVVSRDGKYSGKAVADALASELARIQRMQSSQLFKGWMIDMLSPARRKPEKRVGVLTQSRTLEMPPLQPALNTGGSVPDVAVELAGAKFSLESILRSIRSLWTGRDPEIVVTGSLQVFGGHVGIVGRLDRLRGPSVDHAERGASCVVRAAAGR